MSATHYAAVRATATALRLWRTGEMQGLNGELAGMPHSAYIGASMTLLEAGFATLAAATGKDFDALVEGVVVEMIGLESDDQP